MPLPGKSHLKKREKALRNARDRIGKLETRTLEESQEQKKALEILSHQIKETEKVRTLVEEHTKLLTHAQNKENEIKKISKALNDIKARREKKQEEGEDGSIFDQKISDLEQKLIERQNELNKLQDQENDIVQEVNKLEKTVGFSSDYSPTSVTEICKDIAPNLDLKRPPICEPGEHEEEQVIFPEVPDKEVDVEERIKVIELIDDSKGTTFEVQAARHNNKGKSSIDSGKYISRNLNETEKNEGKNGESQKIRLRCNKCQREREIDHFAIIDGKVTLVECKNKKSLNAEDKRRMIDNRKVALEKGWNVCYKFPKTQASETRIKSVRSKYFGDSEDDDSLEIIGL